MFIFPSNKNSVTLYIIHFERWHILLEVYMNDNYTSKMIDMYIYVYVRYVIHALLGCKNMFLTQIKMQVIVNMLTISTLALTKSVPTCLVGKVASC